MFRMAPASADWRRKKVCWPQTIRAVLPAYIAAGWGGTSGQNGPGINAVEKVKPLSWKGAGICTRSGCQPRFRGASFPGGRRLGRRKTNPMPMPIAPRCAWQSDDAGPARLHRRSGGFGGPAGPDRPPLSAPTAERPARIRRASTPASSTSAAASSSGWHLVWKDLHVERFASVEVRLWETADAWASYRERFR